MRLDSPISPLSAKRNPWDSVQKSTACRICSMMAAWYCFFYVECDIATLFGLC